MNKMEIGDILIYHDVDLYKYPSYILGREEWRDVSAVVLDGVDIFMPFSGRTLKQDVKSYLVKKYLSEEHFQKEGLWTGLVVARKSTQSIAFIQEWADMCSLDNISPLPNPDPHKEFIWHSVDQSVAGVLSYIWKSRGLLAKGWPHYRTRGREFSMKALVPWSDHHTSTPLASGD